MLLRIRSKDGNFRFDLSPEADAMDLFQKIVEIASNADQASITISNQPKGNEVELRTLKGRSLKSLGLNHGDLLFVAYKTVSAPEPPAAVTASSSSQSNHPTADRPWESVIEDPVDTYWRSRDGKIPRQRDAQFCKHGPKGMCDYCMPLEPYDPAYHKEHAIKHLSYHAYLRKLAPKSSGSAVADIPPLSQHSYKVKVPCPTGSHAPWPAGICTSCQPSSITLQSQPFRMVDHLEIASTDVVDRFLQAWRQTGLQRFGWLVGHYEPYDKVPMGVKAVVEAIYEPPQQGELDGLTLGIPWEDEPRIRALSAQSSVPLSIVGLIFTDLDPTPEDRTKNVYKRHANSFFLSSLEAIFAATLQKANVTASKSSPTGTFSSRLVTAVLTGTEDGAIDVSAYQVSEQASAMVEADMIEASVSPGIVRIKEEDRRQGSSRYIPDVFFSYKNEYGLEVKKTAKPAFPVEYLLVNVTHGFPQDQTPIFRSTQFPIENRPGLEDQRIERVLSKLASLGAPDVQSSKNSKPGSAHKTFELAEFLSDYHLVTFLDTTQLLGPDDMKVLIKTVTSPTLLEDQSVLDPVLASDGWQTLMTFARESGGASQQPSSGTGYSGMDEDIPPELMDQINAGSGGGSGGGGDAGGSIRTCPHCTFVNEHSGNDCEVCGLPL